MPTTICLAFRASQLGKKCPPTKYKTIEETIEIPDELVNKTIAVIDELLDRTYDDWEERGWAGVDFPLVPFPFFEKNRLPENIGIDDYWISYWLDTTLSNTIRERTKIIEILNKLGTIEEIRHHPVINIIAGIFKGENFDLVIDRDKLISLRKLIIEKQEKPTAGQKSATQNSPIRKTALQNIAIEIKELTSHSGLSDFFGDFDIPKDLYSVNTSKYERVFSVLSNVNKEMLFRIIEEAVHPLRFFGGDEERALQMQDLFSSFLQFDGYCLQDGKIVRATPKLLKEVKARVEKRKEKPVNQIPNNIGTMPIREPFPIRIVGETEIKGLEKGLKSIATKNEKTTITKGKKYPKSICLISTSLEPQDAVWLVFEERFEMPKRFAVWNKKGETTAVKKLYDIAYEWDVPNKMINYDERVADNINNGLFKNRWVAKYMKTNKLEKPTLVQKSEKGTLVLKNEIPVKTGLIKNVVPLQYQSLYTDKTK